MRHIIKIKTHLHCYVSCVPATLARDSEALVNAGYEVTRLAMLDMFLNTGHLESRFCAERMYDYRLTDPGRPRPLARDDGRGKKCTY